MQRRRMLGLAVAAFVPLAGCGVLGGSGGPTATAKQFLQAIYDQDEERMLELAHDEGPMETDIEQAGYSSPGEEFEIDRTAVLEEADDRARVKIYYQHPGDDWQFHPVIHLRRADGEWRVWDLKWLS